MSHQHAPYLAVFAVTAGGVFLERKSGRFTLSSKATAAATTTAFLVGLAPAAAAQISNYLHHGTPIYPYQFRLLGLTLGVGYSLQNASWAFGLSEYSPSGLLKATVSAWLVPATWPNSFFDGRNFGGGLFFITALLTLPISVARSEPQVRVVLAPFVVASIGGSDYWNPRFAYALLLALAICNGIAVSVVLDELSKRSVHSRWSTGYFAFVALFAMQSVLNGRCAG